MFFPSAGGAEVGPVPGLDLPDCLQSVRLRGSLHQRAEVTRPPPIPPEIFYQIFSVSAVSDSLSASLSRPGRSTTAT